MPKELIYAQRLRDEGKYNEALQVINDIKDLEKFSIQYNCTSQIIKSTCLNRLGFHEEALKLAGQTYQKCKESGNPLQQFDASIELAEASMFIGNIEKALEVITNSENLLNIINQESSSKHSSRYASITMIKGYIYSYSGYSIDKNDINRGVSYYEEALEIEQHLGNTYNVSRILTGLGTISSKQGNWNHALELWKEVLSLEKDGFNETLAYLLYFSGNVYKSKGEFERAFNNYQRGLELAEKLNSNTILISYYVQSWESCI